MSKNKVDINTSKLKSEVINKIENADEALSQASNSFVGIAIPSEFGHKNYIKSIPKLISNIKGDCKDEITWLNSSITNFENFKNNTEANVGNTVISEVPRKEFHIKTVE